MIIGDHELDDNEMRIVIAEHSGLKEVGMMGPTLMHVKEDTLEDVPDYLNSLDAINQAIQSLPVVKQVGLVNNIYRIIGHHDHCEIEAVLASPRVRAEAFILTVKDIPPGGFRIGSPETALAGSLVDAVKSTPKLRHEEISDGEWDCYYFDDLEELRQKFTEILKGRVR